MELEISIQFFRLKIITKTKGGIKMSKVTVKINKSAVTGRFVSNAAIKSSPKTTYVQTVKKKG